MGGRVRIANGSISRRGVEPRGERKLPLRARNCVTIASCRRRRSCTAATAAKGSHLRPSARARVAARPVSPPTSATAAHRPVPRRRRQRQRLERDRASGDSARRAAMPASIAAPTRFRTPDERPSSDAGIHQLSAATAARTLRFATRRVVPPAVRGCPRTVLIAVASAMPAAVQDDAPLLAHHAVHDHRLGDRRLAVDPGHVAS